MWFIIVLVTAISGYPIGQGIGNTVYDTEEACKAAFQGVIERTEKELEPQGAVIQGGACIPKDKVPAKLLKLWEDGKV